MWRVHRVVVCLASVLAATVPAAAQLSPSASAAGPAPAGSVRRHEAEQNLVDLPTTQPLRRFGHQARLAVRGRTFAVVEFSPRVAGHSPPGRGVWAMALERQTGGHVFQVNVSNHFGTTYGQTALGGERDHVYLGFNLARRW